MVSVVGRKREKAGIEESKETGEEGVEEEEEELTSSQEQQISYQIGITIEWVEGLVQRIQQSLISHTPLIMCEKDLDALDFLVLAASCVDPKTILFRIEEIKEEAKKKA